MNRRAFIQSLAALLCAPLVPEIVESATGELTAILPSAQVSGRYLVLHGINFGPVYHDFCDMPIILPADKKLEIQFVKNALVIKCDGIALVGASFIESQCYEAQIAWEEIELTDAYPTSLSPRKYRFETISLI